MAAVSPEDIQAALEAYEKYGNYQTAAEYLGVPRSTLQGRVKLGQREPQKVGSPETPFTVTQKGDSASIVSIGKEIRNADEAFAQSGLDPKIWYVVSSDVRAWQTPMKLRAKDGDSAIHINNIYVSVKCARRAPEYAQLGLGMLLGDIRSRKPMPSVKYRACRSEPHLLEISLYDAHFGKLCWNAETGDGDYDLRLAESIYVKAAKDLMDKTNNFSVERIVVPIGHDFFQSNNWRSETVKGTVVDSVDDRMPKVFRSGVRAVKEMVDYCRGVAPVELLWVPGNHDAETSWYLMEVLGAFYENDKHVTVDNSGLYRKYRTYGPTLFMYTHGNEERHDDLPLIMATEASAEWGNSEFRTARTGHYHKKKERSFTVGDTYNGVSVQVLPSISGTDHWHYKKGYVKGVRAGEGWLWGKETGPSAHFISVVR